MLWYILLLTANGYIDRLIMGRSFHRTGAGIDRLDGDNYLDWSFQVKTYLMAQDLWHIVEATDESTNAEYDPCWTKQNAMTLHVIHVHCEPRFSSLIRLITSAKFAWDTLAAIFELPKSSYIGMYLSLKSTSSNIFNVR